MVAKTFCLLPCFILLVAAWPRAIIERDIPAKRQDLQTDHPLPGVKRVKVRSGPYIIPNMSTRTLPSGDYGSIWNMPHRDIEKPCGECTILRQWAGLEYPDGRTANVDTGLWLHHMVHFTSGPNRWDPVCYNRISIPHLSLWETPETSERFFSSGNERTVMDFNPGGTNMSYGTGYHLTPEDQFHYIVDLMNMNMEDKEVYLTMTYDILPGELPRGWEEVKTVWLDANNCVISDVQPPSENGTFQIGSSPWKPNFEGRIINMVGHLHDGAVAIWTALGDGHILCRSATKYAETSEFVYSGMAMGHAKAARDHISSMTPCFENLETNDVFLKQNQSLSVYGLYDYDKHEGNLEHGGQDKIMAIAMLPIAIPRGGLNGPILY